MNNLESELHQDMLDMYKLAGQETGYWGNYFLRSVKNNGGLATAKRMLSKRLENLAEQKGFQSLLEAGRPDLSLESLILKPKYQDLFSLEELQEAKRRLQSIPDYANRSNVAPEINFPGDLLADEGFSEGSKKRITVNAYERNPKARTACLARHGYRCKVCDIKFNEVYGEIGNEFIHVHHRKPIAGRRSNYTVNPTKDLVPVCPNCHAMLHTSNPPLGIEELKKKMIEA